LFLAVVSANARRRCVSPKLCSSVE
jgi:hypothetical protein